MKESLVYPGEYIPPQEFSSQGSAQSAFQGARPGKPLVNMNQTPGMITVEIALPGVHREQISICARYNILTIRVVGNVACKGNAGEDVVHEFDRGIVERHIVLPEHSDTDFMSAEFRRGVLYLHIARNGADFMADARQVIVY